jgi:hypothetical protein
MSELMARNEPEELYVLWTSQDREVALKMVFMYTANSKLKGWWKDVNLIVWGPSAKLLSEDLELQESIARMRHTGVSVVACKACADSYGVTPALEAMGLEVKYMGQPLTELLKEGKTLITF